MKFPTLIILSLLFTNIVLASEKGKAYFAGGCFWCVEAIFRQVDGIYNINSGYSGGFDDNPTYETVCSESTGHAEVIQFNYDSDKISFEKIIITIKKNFFIL